MDRKNSNYLILLFIFLYGICIGYFSVNISTNGIQYNLKFENTKIKPAQSQNYSLNMYFFIMESCDDCIKKRDNVVRPFNLSYSDINYSEYSIDNYSSPEYDFTVDFLNGSGLSFPGVMVIFETQYGKYVIFSDDLSIDVLNVVYSNLNVNPENYQGWIFYEVSFNIIEAFLNGILSGVNPCVILITIVLGVSIFGSQDKKLIISNIISFILGLVVGYFVIGIIFYFVIDLTSSVIGLDVVKFVIGIPLIILGFWYMIDARKSKSLLFSTPGKVKDILNRLTDKNSAPWSFLLGIIFTLLKSACISAFMFTLILTMSVSEVPILMIFPAMILFSVGLVIPVGSVLVLIGFGISSEKINNFREKYKSWLRFVSGIIIVVATILTII